MDFLNNINSIVSIISGIIAIFSAWKANNFKNETQALKKSILIQHESSELILNLTNCLEKISKLPHKYQRGFDIQKEIRDIQSLFHKSTSLAIAQNQQIFTKTLNEETREWIDELNKYHRNYENMKNNSNAINRENIENILNVLQSNISSIISQCKQNL